MQREFGRLKLNGTIMSKRDLGRLIESKTVRGWDDPRLYTLQGIRRRGIPPGALLAFVAELGVTTANTSIEIKRFEQSVRRYLERNVPRLMLVLDPIPVVTEDAEEQDLDAPLSPKDPKMGSHKIKLTRTVYIERSDFREVDSGDYLRLAPGKTVGLLHMPHPIKAISFTKDDATGAVTEIRAVFEKEGKKPKTYIQWVPEGSPAAEVRVHTALFKSDQPGTAPGGFMNDINPDSEKIWPNAMVETGFYEVRRRAPWPAAEGEKEGEVGPESVRFQAMRVGYFVSGCILCSICVVYANPSSFWQALDSDSSEERIVLNRIVALKEDSGKSG
jgi:glutaminyl-tRNA synthetase